MPAPDRSPRRYLVVVAATVLLLSLPTAGAGAVEDQPQIGFISGLSPISPDPNPVDVYVANADGSTVVNLTAGYGSEWPWAWSPDGTRIAFFSHDLGAVKLFVRPLHAAKPFVVADGPDPDEGLVWSPDGTRIAFVSSQDGNAEVYVADVAARRAANVSNDALASSRPRWSPDGTRIAYDVRSEGTNGVTQDVYIVPASGGTPVNVTNDTAYSPGGSWSPDGARFVFVTNRDGDDDIYVADGDGRSPLRLTSSPANDRNPAWSPDGSRIAFSSGLATATAVVGEWDVKIPSRIHVMASDGSDRRTVTDGSVDPATSASLAHTLPAWSPDGSLLAFAVTVTGIGPHQYVFTAYVVDPQLGGAPTELWSSGGSPSLDWSPDGTRLAIGNGGGNYGIDRRTVIVAADGSGAPVEVGAGVGSGSSGWSTYGSHLAYYNGGGAGPGDTVFVTAPDGTAPVDITAGLTGPVNSASAWRPQPLGPVGLVDTSTGKWLLDDGWGHITTFYYGDPGDVPFMGDWDCDGVDTPGLFRTSNALAYLRNANSQGNANITFFFGNPNDVPLAGDFNGDGCDTLSIYRPSQQRFYIINELGIDGGGLGAAEFDFAFGNPGDTPVIGDWDGDDIDEVGLYRESTGLFYWRNTLTTGVADDQILFGNPGDRFVAGDWGVVDGSETPAVFRPSNTTFYFRHTLTQGAADSQYTWPGGDASWIPVAVTLGKG